jgi:hypothetical protein
MLGEHPILVRGEPPWVAARPGISWPLHRDLVHAGFGVLPPIGCDPHGSDDGLGCFDVIELDRQADLRAVEDWLATWVETPIPTADAA